MQVMNKFSVLEGSRQQPGPQQLQWFGEKEDAEAAAALEGSNKSWDIPASFLNLPQTKFLFKDDPSMDLSSLKILH